MFVAWRSLRSSSPHPSGAERTMRMPESHETNRPRPRFRRTSTDLRPDDHDLTARLHALEIATDQGAVLLVEEQWGDAASAWRTISLVTESIFGSDDESTIDAMRIAALAMSRADLHEEARGTLCAALERTLRIEGFDAVRAHAIRREIEGTSIRALS